MAPSRKILLLASLQLLSCRGAQNTTPAAKPIIIDTDIKDDVDDMGALAIANALHNCGSCDLKAILIDTRSHYGALAASVVDTYYGNRYITIAAIRPLTNETFFDDSMFHRSEYASKVAYNWPRVLDSANLTTTPASLYSSVLESADNDSLTTVWIGFQNNLAALLNTTDGPDLISSKVHEVVTKGGQYASGWEYKRRGGRV